MTDETRHLSVEMRGDIENAFDGKRYAYTAVTHESGAFGLGVAVEGERGYSPVPLYHYHAEAYDTASAEAHRINKSRGLSDDEATAIVASTMRAQYLETECTFYLIECRDDDDNLLGSDIVRCPATQPIKDVASDAQTFLDGEHIDPDVDATVYVYGPFTRDEPVHSEPRW